MPKETKAPVHPHRVTPLEVSHRDPDERKAGVWTSSEDEKLLEARARGLNWQPIASNCFPSKTANACRKRHERLMDRRQGEDWDARKLDLLAQEYLAVREEMWEILATRIGEKWTLVEAKCLEKGLKTLTTINRSANRRSTAASGDDRGNHDHDSGISLGSDAEMEVGDVTVNASAGPSTYQPNQPSRSASSLFDGKTQNTNHRNSQQHDHERSRSLPQPLPLYQPPPPVQHARRMDNGAGQYFPPPSAPGSGGYWFGHSQSRRASPDSANSHRGSISIQSMLSPAEPHHA